VKEKRKKIWRERERERRNMHKNSPAPISRNIGAQNNEEKGEREK
jgi:hypothetical protein